MPSRVNNRGRCLVYSINIGLAAAFIYVSQASDASRAVNVHFEHVLDEGWTFPDAPHIPLRKHYTGTPLDVGLSFLVAAFMPAAAAFDPASWMQQLYFLMSFFPVIATITIEAVRRENAGTIMSHTSLWAIPYQTIGGALVLPLWFNSLVMATFRQQYRPGSLDVPGNVARVLLPALIIGYLLPTTLVYLPFWSHDSLQRLVAVWQPCPLYVNAFVWLGSKLCRASAEAKESTSGYVRNIYLATGTVSAATHLVFVLACAVSSDPRLTVARVLFPPKDETLTMTIGLLVIFQTDFALIMASALLWAFWSAYNSPGSGSVRPSTLGHAIKVLALTVVLGPGAALAATMYWRESTLGGTRLKAVKKTR